MFPASVLGEAGRQPAGWSVAETVSSLRSRGTRSEGQRIAAEFGHRVHNEKVVGEFKDKFPAIRLVNVNDVFGGWTKIQKEHFASGATLDTLYGSR